MPNAARRRQRPDSASTNPFTSLAKEHAPIPRQPGQPASEEAVSRDRLFHDRASVIDELRRTRLAVKPEVGTKAKTRNRDRLR